MINLCSIVAKSNQCSANYPPGEYIFQTFLRGIHVFYYLVQIKRIGVIKDT